MCIRMVDLFGKRDKEGRDQQHGNETGANNKDIVI